MLHSTIPNQYALPGRSIPKRGQLTPALERAAPVSQSPKRPRILTSQLLLTQQANANFVSFAAVLPCRVAAEPELEGATLDTLGSFCCIPVLLGTHGLWQKLCRPAARNRIAGPVFTGIARLLRLLR